MPEIASHRREDSPTQVPPAAEVAAPETSAAKRSLKGQPFEAQEKALAPGGALDRERSPGRTESPAPAGEATQAAAPAGDTIGGAIVLSRDPTYAASGYAGWFSQQVADKASAWGAPAGGAAARVAKDGAGKDAMVLDWPGAWGSAPVTKEMPDLNFGPIEAKLAVLGAAALPGWAKVPPADQPVVTGLLGGETNGVSAAARRHLGPQMAALKAGTEEAQAGALSGLIGSRDATPSLVGEAVQTAPVGVALASPKTQANFEFRGGKADAEVHLATFDDGTTLEIVAPKSPDPSFHQHSVAEVAEAARYVPKKNREAIKQVVLNTVRNPDDAHWAVKYNTPSFRSYMTAGAAGVVTIYPNESAPQPQVATMRGTLIHETGHSWSYQQWGTDKAKGKWVDWKKCMDSDRVSVSDYAMNDIAEDVAETVQVYGSTKGTPKYTEYQALIPARLKMLEKELG